MITIDRFQCGGYVLDAIVLNIKGCGKQLLLGDRIAGGST